jgi:acyl carrier protein
MNVVDREQIYMEAKEIIQNYLRLDEDEIKPDTHIVNDAGADSLALVELGFQLTEKFGVPISDTSDEKLIFKNLVDYIHENMKNL